MSKTRSFT